MAKLENDLILVALKSKGAEMSSLMSKRDKTEFIWQAGAKYWPWHAPVCFPIVGKLVDNQYQVGDDIYSLSIHGFARNMEFEEILAVDDRIVYRLSYNEATLARFPFKFQLQIAYSLAESGVSTEYLVKNLDDKPMYFSIGGHMGFNCPLTPYESFSDYELVFEKAEPHFVGAKFAGDRRDLLSQQGKIALAYEFFQEGAVFLANLQSQFVTLRGRKSGKSLTVYFADFPYLGIWTKSEGAPFVCIEPRYKKADNVGESKEISRKEGMLQLQAGAEFRCSYEIVI